MSFSPRQSMKLAAVGLLLALILGRSSLRGQVLAVNGMVVTSAPMASQAGLRLLPSARVTVPSREAASRGESGVIQSRKKVDKAS